MNLVLNNLQKLICHKIQPTNQLKAIWLCVMFTVAVAHIISSKSVKFGLFLYIFNSKLYQLYQLGFNISKLLCLSYQN